MVRIEPRGAIRADAVAEFRVRVLTDVRFDLLPVPGVVRIRLQEEQIGSMPLNTFTLDSTSICSIMSSRVPTHFFLRRVMSWNAITTATTVPASRIARRCTRRELAPVLPDIDIIMDRDRRSGRHDLLVRAFHGGVDAATRLAVVNNVMHLFFRPTPPRSIRGAAQPQDS